MMEHLSIEIDGLDEPPPPSLVGLEIQHEVAAKRHPSLLDWFYAQCVGILNMADGLLGDGSDEDHIDDKVVEYMRRREKPNDRFAKPLTLQTWLAQSDVKQIELVGFSVALSLYDRIEKYYPILLERPFFFAPEQHQAKQPTKRHKQWHRDVGVPYYDQSTCWITPIWKHCLFIGPAPAPVGDGKHQDERAIKFLQSSIESFGITHQVSMMQEEHEAVPGLVYAQFGIDDLSAEHQGVAELAPMILAAADQVAEWIQQGHRVLVHCAHGYWRSATVVYCYLLRYGKLSMHQVRLLFARRRPCHDLHHLEAWLASFDRRHCLMASATHLPVPPVDDPKFQNYLNQFCHYASYHGHTWLQWVKRLRQALHISPNLPTHVAEVDGWVAFVRLLLPHFVSSSTPTSLVAIEADSSTIDKVVQAIQEYMKVHWHTDTHFQLPRKHDLQTIVPTMFV